MRRDSTRMKREEKGDRKESDSNISLLNQNKKERLGIKISFPENLRWSLIGIKRKKKKKKTFTGVCSAVKLDISERFTGSAIY